MTVPSSSKRRTRGANPWFTADAQKSGFTVDPGPYEAIVKQHVTGTRMGQLMVYIPDWGGNQYYENDGTGSTSSVTGNDPNNTKNYILVSYASPFYGKTYGTDTQELPNSAHTAGQSYGMWMVPPDIGNKVLVTFAGGDIQRGYWFACVYDSTSHHMVPGISRSVGGSNYTTANADSVISQSIGTGSNLPVTEFSTTDPNAFNTDAITSTNRYVHDFQATMLTRQGLDRDTVRGATSSSSLRESPSRVFGISTPGQPSTTSLQFPSTNNPQLVADRIGGHTFVMDDGAVGDTTNKAGIDQMIKLRTSFGHQILMHDTENILYIGSASGNQWLEFSADGSINVYGATGFNLRSQGPINFHSDSAIIMQSPVIQMNASGGKSSGSAGIIMNSTGVINAASLNGMTFKTDTVYHASGAVSAMLSSVGLTTVTGEAWCKVISLGSASISSASTQIEGGKIDLISPLATGLASAATTGGGVAQSVLGLAGAAATNKLQDTAYNPGQKVWVSNPEALQSVCTVVPAHEPWVGDDGKQRPKPQVPKQSFLGSLGI